MILRICAGRKYCSCQVFLAFLFRVALNILKLSQDTFYSRKQYRKWEVRISVHGKRIYLGRFNSELEAARAYDAATVKYHGRYANVNLKT